MIKLILMAFNINTIIRLTLYTSLYKGIKHLKSNIFKQANNKYLNVTKKIITT